jgi:thymidylate synthase (FAD)
MASCLLVDGGYMKIEVLNNGFVELVEVLGNDLAIVNAARTSYVGDSKGDVLDKKLLFYLMKQKHTTPFEMVQFKFRVKAPIFVVRQWFRHRTWSYNEMSRRYSDAPPEFYYPDVWREQSETNKQGSSGVGLESFSAELNGFCELGVAKYDACLDVGIAKEMARFFLPINMYTIFVGSVNAHNLMRFLKLRMDMHAQYEIRLYANAIYEMFEAQLPWTAEAYETYIANSN